MAQFIVGGYQYAAPDPTKPPLVSVQMIGGPNAGKSWNIKTQAWVSPDTADCRVQMVQQNAAAAPNNWVFCIPCPDLSAANFPAGFTVYDATGATIQTVIPAEPAITQVGGRFALFQL